MSQVTKFISRRSDSAEQKLQIIFNSEYKSQKDIILLVSIYIGFDL